MIVKERVKKKQIKVNMHSSIDDIGEKRGIIKTQYEAKHSD